MINKRNFIIILISNFIVSSSLTMIMPFLSLYIETFGDFPESYVQTWAGLIFGATFVTALIMSPVWGRIADKYGYKPIMIINCFGIAISIFLMGYVQNVVQFFILRLAMGLVTGFIPTSMAFISKHTPKKIAGKTLGTLQIGSVGGTLFGPVIGGSLADAIGFSFTFIYTSIAISIAAIIIIVGIHEPEIIRKEKNTIYSRRNILWAIFHHPLILSTMIVASLIQIGNFSIQPLLSLYVSHLTTTEQVAMWAGITFSATGVGNLLIGRYFGKLADSIGYEKVLMRLLFISVFFIVPQSFVTSLWQLIVLRFLYGIFSGGLIPIITALIRREAPIEVQGEIMGYNQSFRFLGNIIGPVLGGVVSGFATISGVFYLTGLLFLIAATIIFIIRKRPKKYLEDVLKNHQ
ncbi:MFS transporter [Lysinibacillus yapensis]|uniref:MFS transporter n=1 Tax=Ureibacillus yapensis TaxID=2304605 RepID=A0A396S824_9BACL|nr:MFS transporter [Lysinibacillus yapensis]RHW36830.1 MFS transporter [Lysinibacillus yapensis]